MKPGVMKKNLRSRPTSRTVQKAILRTNRIPENWLRFGECKLDSGVGLWGIEPTTRQPPTPTHLPKFKVFIVEVKQTPLEQSDILAP